MEKNNLQTIMIVDDKPENLSFLRIILEKNNFKIIIKKTSKSAIEYFYKNAIDLVLLDIVMPDISGYEICSEFRKTSDIPILFISALQSLEDKLKAFDAGGNDFITKPFLKEEVLYRVKLHLENYNSHKKINESKEEYQRIVNSIREAYFKCDADGNILFYSPSLVKMLKIPDSHLKKNLDFFDYFENKKRDKDSIFDISDNEITITFDVELKNFDDEILNISLKANRIIENKKLKFVEVLLIDITDQKRQQEEIQKRKKTLNLGLKIGKRITGKAERQKNAQGRSG